MNKQQGFTLIELVAVIVILGALAAVALPRFINLEDEAQAASLAGVAGAAGSAHAVNFAGSLAGDADAKTVDNCDDTSTLMQGGLPDGYSVTAKAISAGGTADCTLNQVDTGNPKIFTGYYAS